MLTFATIVLAMVAAGSLLFSLFVIAFGQSAILEILAAIYMLTFTVAMSAAILLHLFARSRDVSEKSSLPVYPVVPERGTPEHPAYLRKP